MGNEDFFVELQCEFLNEALAMMEVFEQSLLELEGEKDSANSIAQIFRVAHSIKGGASAVGFKELAEFAHRLEDMLVYLRVNTGLISEEIISILLQSCDSFKNHLNLLSTNPESTYDYSSLLEQINEKTKFLEKNKNHVSESQTGNTQTAKRTATLQTTFIKVDDRKVENLLDSVGEIVVLKNQILYDKNLQDGMDPRLSSVLDQLDRMVRDLYDKTLGLRLTPLNSLFLKLQRIVRDVSLQLEKDVDLRLKGENTEVERNVSETLVDPLVHMVRNALDHGIEPPNERISLGKPGRASLLVNAEQVGGSIRITVKDDGRGIDRNRVLRKAIDSGIIDEGKALSMTNQEVYQLLFAPGFSTAAQVTDLSGRGVGLDVVKSNLEKVGGRIDIESELGQGSTFSLLIPLTTAIIDGIIFEANRDKFILPVQSIKEIIQIDPSAILEAPGKTSLLKVRNEVYPYFNWEQSSGRVGFLVEMHEGVIILGADSVIGQTQAVVKPLPTKCHSQTFSGTAVMGDGSTVLILNTQEMMSMLREAA